MATVQGIVTRLCILGVGVFFGLILAWPMMMMCASGKALQLTVSYLGTFGCLFLVIGGILGALMKRWIALLPGTVLVLIALILLVAFAHDPAEPPVDMENSGDGDYTATSS